MYFNYVDDWRVDGYHWFQYGTREIPRKKPVIKKVHFAIILHSGVYDRKFRRQAFFILGDSDAVYLGNENIAEDFPHGNSKSYNNKSYHRTYPSTLTKYATTDDLPSNLYKKAITKSDCN